MNTRVVNGAKVFLTQDGDYKIRLPGGKIIDLPDAGRKVVGYSESGRIEEPESVDAIRKSTPRRLKVVARFGDSNGYGFNVNTHTIGISISHARRLLNGRCLMPGYLNFAVPGATLDGQGGTSNALLQVDAMTAWEADILYGSLGVNSVTNMTRANMEAKVNEIVAKAKTKIKQSICFDGIMLKGTSQAFTTAQTQRALAYNRYLRYLSETDPFVEFFDPNVYVSSFTTSRMLPAATYDDTHLYITYSLLKGKKLAEWLASVYSLPIAAPKFIPAGDIYDATENPYGNLILNSNFANPTSGTINNPTNGDPAVFLAGVPQGFTAYASGGSTHTVTPSVEDDPTYAGMKVLKLTMGGTNNGKTTVLHYTGTLAPTAGEKFVGSAPLELNLPAGYQGVSVFCVLEGAGYSNLASGADGGVLNAPSLGNLPYPALTEILPFETDPIVAPAGVQTWKWQISIVHPASGTAPADVKLRMPFFGKVR